MLLHEYRKTEFTSHYIWDLETMNQVYSFLKFFIILIAGIIKLFFIYFGVYSPFIMATFFSESKFRPKVKLSKVQECSFFSFFSFFLPVKLNQGRGAIGVSNNRNFITKTYFLYHPDTRSWKSKYTWCGLD